MSPAQDDSAALRLLVFCAGDPEAARPFSGSARNLIHALERRGCVHHKANVLGLSDPFDRGGLPVRAFRKLDRIGLEEAYRWTQLYVARNSRRARRIAAAHPGYNACFMYGTSYHPALPVATYCYFDATAAQVWRARAWEFARFTPTKAAAVIQRQRDIFEHCTGIFPRSEWAARSVADDYATPPEKIHVAGAGPNDLPEALPHSPYDRQTILFIGVEFERKGGPLIVEAFRKLRATMPDARLLIVGCTPDIDVPGVSVIGRISKDSPEGRQRLLELYAEASVFCIMSDFEPFGIVVLEAQNSYVPCVLPDRFAFPEMIRDGETGTLVNEDSAGVLAATLERLLGDPARLEAMGRAGNAYVRDYWNWDLAAERIHTQILKDLRASTRS